MNTPSKIRSSALTLNAMMEAFEHCYLSVLDFGECDPELREKGCYAFYGLRDMLTVLTKEMEELAGHMEVCDVVLNVRKKIQEEIELERLRQKGGK